MRQQLEAAPWAATDASAGTPSHQRIPDEPHCAVIDRIDILGRPVSQSLQRALHGVQGDDSPIGRCLGAQGVTLLLQRVQQALVEQGYLTSQAYAPEQDMRNGVLTLHILEGRVAQIRSLDQATPLPRMAWATSPGEILNLRDIEQSSENLQRLPSLDSQLQIEPGQMPGTSDLTVMLQSRRPIRMGLTVDDSGQRSTGKLQGNLSASWDNPLGLTDLFYLSLGKELGDRDRGPRGSRNRIVHYSLPWGYWLLSGNWSANSYHQRVFGPYESYRYHGSAYQKELALSRVLHRDGVSKTVTTLKGFWRRSNNSIDDLEVIVQRRRTSGLDLTLQHQRQIASSTVLLQWMRRQARDTWGDPARPVTYGQKAVRLDQLHLHLNVPLTQGAAPWTYHTQLQWQWASTDLSAQDRLCLGGRYSVRGFDGQQSVCGDGGQLWRNELATSLPASISPTASTQVYLAWDTARATTRGLDGGQGLSGMALGMRGQHRFSDGYALHWEVFVGQPLSQPHGMERARHSGGFSARAEF
ncbi:ShlB/FhaC/HecB family hemolysin secretion/activation protein [Herbaspirillum seropedicae]|uniref:ShlB/FhaC/HecB family hemolysin secretion/activation protein n=1 Tax=Herbaspirillum seropedicae TaxID=964 RepID=UPI0015DFAD5D|nr:ShlB/FhaC/HecB family hemolysin secretion/activation protein [Herbaspirillum seropedicae]